MNTTHIELRIEMGNVSKRQQPNQIAETGEGNNIASFITVILNQSLPLIIILTSAPTITNHCNVIVLMD